MTFLKPIRIDPAFDDPQQIRAMFTRYAPSWAVASYAPDGVKDETHEAKRPVLPWFRGDWALDGKPLVAGADLILHNQKFIDAAKAAFGTSFVNPEFVAIKCLLLQPMWTTHPFTGPPTHIIPCRFSE